MFNFRSLRLSGRFLRLAEKEKIISFKMKLPAASGWGKKNYNVKGGFENGTI